MIESGLVVEASNLLDEAGVNLPPLPEEKKYRLLFYRRGQAASELRVEELQSDEVNIKLQIEGVFQQLTDRFAAAGEDCVALFQLGLRAKLSLGTSFDTAELQRLATEASLPEEVWRDVMDALANEVDYDRAGREMDRLDKRVERFLGSREKGH